MFLYGIIGLSGLIVAVYGLYDFVIKITKLWFFFILYLRSHIFHVVSSDKTIKIVLIYYYETRSTLVFPKHKEKNRYRFYEWRNIFIVLEFKQI